MENLGVAPSSATQTHSSNLSLARASLLGCSALLLAIFLLVTALLVYIAHDQNHEAEAHSHFDSENALQGFEKLTRSIVKDYAFWGDAYRHLHLQVDPEWAFVRQNLGSTLFSDLGYQGVFVVGPDDRTVYALVYGQLQSVTLQGWLNHSMAALIAQARQDTKNATAVSTFVDMDGVPALVTAAALSPGTDPSVHPDNRPPSVLLFVARLDPARLEALGRDFGVEQLRAASSGDTSLPTLALADGGAAVQWTPERPGDQLLVLVLPLLASAGLVFGLMAWFILRRTTAAARIMDTEHASLVASRWALAASEERFRDVAEASSDWIWEVDGQLHFTYLSERFQVVTGLSRDSCLGRPVDEILRSDQGALSTWFKDHARRANAVLQCNYQSGDGRARICRLSVREIEGRGYRGTATDITEEVEARRRIEYLSQHDALTGLANRTRMQEFLEGKLKSMPTLETPLAMLSIDLDRFKPVNDLLGHAAGDQVLNEVSQRLAGCLRGDDLVARIGGDEFVLVVVGMASYQEVESLCRRLIDCIELPFSIAEHEVFISASIGIAMAPVDATLAEELLRYADIALYEAKEAGRNTWRFYAGDMNARIVERRQLESDLRLAIKQDQLRLHFQPRYRLQGKQLAGAEALVRWQHPQRGLLGPELFIPIAEETGLILPLSNWVLHTACRAAASWPDDVVVSVNLSPTEFQRGHLVARVKAALAESGLAPARLELELTESVMLDDAQGALNIMQGLKALGVRLLMDDFGTGYSSLSYLRSFPFDGLKIDRSFVGGLTAGGGDRSIIQAIVGLGRALSLTVTAEGVETPDQLSALNDVQCDEAQGFYLSEPMDAQAIAQLIRRKTDPS
ncbi:EAL domain-containing protein [Pseudomonas sp. SK3(2021)]|uniref:bifunctional diguanylate cyclase/phosphodiesterase n=1 Tax=Pseudomonas sp. SK3(2021) TaxID=2841064 RepID=UPI00192A8464|nr:EAL domain-containing protein [Pseudomonas sp. SK3(2021)]QQZ44492.1 EAL domain-containing protein [Pseudomonas sp. SK3(2021)]